MLPYLEYCEYHFNEHSSTDNLFNETDFNTYNIYPPQGGVIKSYGNSIFFFEEVHGFLHMDMQVYILTCHFHGLLLTLQFSPSFLG